MRTMDLGRSLDVLASRDEFQEGTLTEDEYVHDYLVNLIVHEVGHTLGLRHNFAGSAMTPYYDVNHEYWTRQHGLAGSVMDYTVSNISPRGELQGEYYGTSLGDYDRWAIEYGYKPLDAATPDAELPALGEIASRSNEFRYATDEQVGGWSRNPDPDNGLWDLTDDAVRYGRDRLQVADQLMTDTLAYWSDPGTMPSKINQAFIYSFYDYVIVASNVPREIGGVRVYRNRVGDSGNTPAMAPVSAEDQRRALAFLNEKIWSSDSYQFDPAILNMLGRDQRDYFDWMSMYTGIYDFDLHDWVLMAQTSPLYWIYDPLVLERVLNNERRMPDGGDIFTMTELFDTVRNDIWSEVTAGENIDSFRRNLQRAYLDMITGMYLTPANGTPEDAVTLARHDLVVLQGQISAAIAGDGPTILDEMTVAHLEECLSRINLTLQAPMGRGGNVGITLMF
ncbi:MAG: zinc-dependent metalloprotease [bacterium]|nr:zinc-dependent metalloprotease [bacterium]